MEFRNLKDMEVIIGSKVSKGMLPLLALHTFTEYYRLGTKPPVTAALITANTLFYLRPPLLVKQKGLKQFFLSAFYHVGEPHLVYNMISLLWKGIQLETSMGSVEFASMVASLLALSQGITLMMSKSLYLFYKKECVVGFSGVLFAMEVVLNSQSEYHTYVHGVMVRSRYAAWAELLLIQMFVPGVSFLGHLGGILAGLLYLRLRRGCSGSDPLTFLMRGVNAALNWPLKFVRGLFRFWPSRRTVGGNLMRRRTTVQSGVWTCRACTYYNSGLLSVCEMCGTGKGGDGLPSFRWIRDSGGSPLDGLCGWRIDRLGSTELKELQSKKRKNVIKPPEPPKELVFRCPICLGPLVEEMSTRCGHIFCKICIKDAVRGQGKCPTCRKRITVEDLIRVFLPSTR